jgi:VCBS repeat protein
MITLRTLATLLLTFTTALPCAAEISTTRDDRASTAGARGIAVADLNRDGWLDIATANNDPDGVAVLTNRGAGGGYTSTFIPIAGGPFDITTGDMNKDGVPDLVVANPDANEIDVLFGQPSGGFAAPLHVGAMFNPRGVAVGDIDRDGNLDIVYTLYNNQGVVVLYGDGAGNFAMRNGPATVGITPQGVAIADFNMDGWPDLVVASSGSVGLTIMYQTPGGAGTFTRQDLNVPRQQNVVVVGDFNRDGRPDIAAASTGTSEITIFINGKGFTETLVYPSGGGSTRGIAAVDLDRDGAVDVVVGNRGTSTIDVLPGHGDGTFGTAYGFAAGAGSRTVAVGDFDNDGRVDIASGNEYAASVTVLSNTTAFTQSAYAFSFTRLAGAPAWGGYSSPSSADVGDFDLDGRLDAVTKGPSGDNAVVLLSSGAQITLTTLYDPIAMHATTLNGDGYPDIVLLDRGTNPDDRSRIESYIGAGNGQFPGRKMTQTSLVAFDMRMADFNRDGRIDAAVIGQPGSGAQPMTIQIYLGNGDGSFTAGAAITFSSTFGGLVVGDVNRDGAVDVTSFTAADSGSATALTWLNDGRGTFAGSPRAASLDGLQYITGADLGDVDHDGWPDLVVAGYPVVYDIPHRSTELLMGAPAGFGAPSFIVTGDQYDFPPHLADITLDGNLDLLTETGQIIPGHGDGTFDAPQAFDFSTPDMVVLDFNKDGLPDIFARDTDGSVQILLNQHRDTNLAPAVTLPQDFSIQYRYQFGDGEELELDAQGSDPDLHRLGYRWYDGSGKLLADTGAFNFFTPPLMNPGSYTYTVEVNDGRGGTARDSVTITVLPEKELVFYVADQIPDFVGDKWSRVEDASAAGQFALHDRNDGAAKVTTPLGSPASDVDVEFVADPTQTYKFWVRLKADSDSWANDSLWLQFSGAVDASGNTYAPGSTSGIAVNLEECSGCGVSGWGWRDESWGAPGAMGTLTLQFPKGGIQHLRFQTREDGVSVDQIVLSAEKYKTTRPGSVKNDATILRPTPY